MMSCRPMHETCNLALVDELGSFYACFKADTQEADILTNTTPVFLPYLLLHLFKQSSHSSVIVNYV